MTPSIVTIVPMALTSSACDNHAWSLGSLIVLLIGGVIIGLLGKFVAPGSRDSIPLWLTVVCGIAGILLGNWLYVDVFGGKCATSGRRLAAPHRGRSSPPPCWSRSRPRPPAAAGAL